MLYSLVYPQKDVFADFYYVAMKTCIPGPDLLKELKSDVHIYNIIFMNSIKIFVVNSEHEMEVLRFNLSELFNPDQTFDVFGEGLSIELCIDNVLSSTIPHYDQFYQNIDNEKRRTEAIISFNKMINVHSNLRMLIKDKKIEYIEWVYDSISTMVFKKLNYTDLNFFISDKVNFAIVCILRQNKYNICSRELEILGNIQAIRTLDNKSFRKLLDHQIIKCDLLIGVSHFIKFPRNKRGRICTQNAFCGLHSKGYISNCSVKTDKIETILTSILDTLFYNSIYTLCMLYFYNGVKGFIQENWIIRLILDKWICS
jgi:hypothetical protein